MKDKSFTIRTYGRLELASYYYPNVSPTSAWRHLRKDIRLYKGLLERLHQIGYDIHCRSFTPAQVKAIVDCIGEP